jgi:uncharacterized YigZ family protein
MKEVFNYKTITTKSEGIYKEKGSKFIGYAYPINSVEDFKTNLDALKKEHSSARHFCYAYRIGVGQNEQYRYNDDGEPSNSAGKPIYGQILSYEITNVLIIVVRYFGGTKLGVGGLISAYKLGAKDSLDNNTIITRDVTKTIVLEFTYETMSAIMSLVKRNDLKILNQEFGVVCNIKLDITLKKYDELYLKFEKINGVEIKKG